MRSPFGKSMGSLLGLPEPARLQRPLGGYLAEPLKDQIVMVGCGAQSPLSTPVLRALQTCGARVAIDTRHAGLPTLKAAAHDAMVDLTGLGSAEQPQALIYDASGMRDVDDLQDLYAWAHPVVGKLARNAHVLLLTAPATADDGAKVAAVREGLTGFMRSLGKELGRRGTNVNLLRVAGKGAGLEGALRYFLTPHASFVSGQALDVGDPVTPVLDQPVVSLVDKVAVVTGAARGIGAAIAEALAREGARVFGVDRPQEEEQLNATMTRFGGQPLLVDVTAVDAAEQILEATGAVDAFVHNAGMTRDRTLKNMTPAQWDAVLELNLAAIMRIDERLLKGGLALGGRTVCIASINGIAGAAGQTNYATTKAGLIAYVAAQASVLAREGRAINAVAPGFIETQMTAQMPMMVREFGRRLNSFAQGGLPADVAEAVAFLASPYASGINGRTLRVCGQNLVGA